MKDLFYWLANERWLYLVGGLPVTIFLVLFYFRNKTVIGNSFTSFIIWAKHSLETANQASPEKITAFVVINFVYVPGRLYFVLKIIDPLHLLYGSLIDAGLVLVLYGIIKPSQIIELKNGMKVENKTEDVK